MWVHTSQPRWIPAGVVSSFCPSPRLRAFSAHVSDQKSTRKHPVRAQCFCSHASHSISRRPTAAAQSRVCKSLTSKVWYQIECILVSVVVAVVYCELSVLIQCKFIILQFWCKSQFSSVTQLWPTLCDPMNRSTPGLPVHHQLPEFTQAHVHWVGDAIQPFHPLSSPCPAAFIFPSIRVFLNESAFHIRWPKY